MAKPKPTQSDDWHAKLFRRHMLVGWWTLLLFILLGVALESFHGLKLAWYLSVDSETRRLLWTLAHSHGTLLAVLHLCFAATLWQVFHPASPASSALQITWLTWASLCLIGAGVLMPAGFFLGGWFHYSGDPGLGILFVPIGALLLVASIAITAILVSVRFSSRP